MIRHLLGLSIAAVVGGGGAFAADLYDCSRLTEGENPECLCAVPIEQFYSDPATLSNIHGDVNVTTANQYMQVDSQSDRSIALNIGDGALFRNSNANALLTFGPTCGRELQGRASLVIREVGYGYTNVEGGSGADLAPGGTCACAALTEERRAGIFPVYPVIGGLILACVVGAAIDDPDFEVCSSTSVSPD